MKNNRKTLKTLKNNFFSTQNPQKSCYHLILFEFVAFNSLIILVLAFVHSLSHRSLVHSQIRPFSRLPAIPAFLDTVPATQIIMRFFSGFLECQELENGKTVPINASSWSPLSRITNSFRLCIPERKEQNKRSHIGSLRIYIISGSEIARRVMRSTELQEFDAIILLPWRGPPLSKRGMKGVASIFLLLYLDLPRRHTSIGRCSSRSLHVISAKFSLVRLPSVSNTFSLSIILRVCLILCSVYDEWLLNEMLNGRSTGW